MIVFLILFCGFIIIYALCQCAGRADDWADRVACLLEDEEERND